MKITRLELPTKDLQAQKEYYFDVLGLSAVLSAARLEVRVGETDLVFIQAESDFDGAYHLAINIPENHFHESK